MFDRTKLVFPALIASLFVGAVGCESDSSSDKRDRETRTDRLDRNDRYRGDVYDRDRTDDRLANRDRVRRGDDDAVLSGDRMSGVPRNARRVDSAQGTNEMMYESRSDATIYVYDADADKVVYTGTLRAGDRFVLDPNDNMALINGKKVFDQDLKSRHIFRLYVLEDRERARY